VTSVGLSSFNYQDDARSNKHKIIKKLQQPKILSSKNSTQKTNEYFVSDRTVP